jgi:hypothetical protein
MHLQSCSDSLISKQHTCHRRTISRSSSPQLSPAGTDNRTKRGSPRAVPTVTYRGPRPARLGPPRASLPHPSFNSKPRSPNRIHELSLIIRHPEPNRIESPGGSAHRSPAMASLTLPPMPPNPRQDAIDLHKAFKGAPPLSPSMASRLNFCPPSQFRGFVALPRFDS